MSLAGFFDFDVIAKRFPTASIKEYGLSEIDALIECKPNDISQMGMSVWHQIVTRSLYKVDPQEMGSHMGDPLLYKMIEKKLKQPILKDILAVLIDVSDESLDDTACAQVIVAWTYPNDLILLDVNFQDPHQVIPKNKRKYQHQTHKGLGLIDSFMTALEVKAKELNCDHILLVAADKDLVPLFKRYGFDLDGSQASKIAYQMGFSIPMSKSI
ncbi:MULTISPECIES: hypothetical protein [Pseudomonas]|jgi:hypothetical protein|uniref:hypothetical protein n=1 Tax=Pseudomonas sp. P7759 TaxID=2738831 RepID=UPI0015A282B6|nr:hypothetical protein [Pseudomonas sp. P7759]NWC72586.1 hypothetical protein [Pseudomonas sp. P7759]